MHVYACWVLACLSCMFVSACVPADLLHSGDSFRDLLVAIHDTVQSLLVLPQRGMASSVSPSGYDGKGTWSFSHVFYKPLFVSKIITFAYFEKSLGNYYKILRVIHFFTRIPLDSLFETHSSRFPCSFNYLLTPCLYILCRGYLFISPVSFCFDRQRLAFQGP